MILVSHDRDFLDRTVTSVLAAKETARWIRICRRLLPTCWRSAASGKARCWVYPRRETPKGVATEIRERFLPLPPQQNESFRFKEKHALAPLPERIGGA